MNIVFKKIQSKITILVIIFVFIAIKQIIFVIAIPPWQNHDEPAHFHYTQYLVENKKLPVIEGAIKARILSFSEEYAESEILIDATRIMRGPNEQFRFIHQRFANVNFDYDDIATKLSGLSRQPLMPSQAPDEYSDLYHKLPDRDIYVNSAAPYQPLYYLLEAIPYKLFYKSDIITRLYAMRLFSTLIYLASIFICYLIAMRLTKNFKLSIVLTIIIGLLPVFGHLTTGINNATLLILLSTLSIYWYIRIIQKLSLTNGIGLGITLGLGMITKPQFVVFPLLIIIPILYHFFYSKENKTKVLKIFLLTGAILLVLSSWWFLWNYSQYGSFIYQNDPSATIQNYSPLSPGKIFYFIFFRWIYEFASYNFAFGFATEILLPAWIIVTITGLTIISLVGLAKLAIKKIKETNIQKKFQIALIICAPLLLELLLFYLFTKTLLNVGHSRFPTDGRYLLPTVFCFTFLWLIGILSLIPKKYYKWAYIIIVIGMVIINVITLFQVILPKFYL